MIDWYLSIILKWNFDINVSSNEFFLLLETFDINGNISEN